MLLCLCVMGLRWVLASAGKRGPIGRIFIEEEPYGVPFSVQTASEWTTFRAMLSTLFAEIIVVDRDCGLRGGNCPRYCGNAEFSEFLCRIECQNTTVSFPQQSCKSPRYDPSLSPDSQLIAANWTTRVQLTRNLFGDIRSDKLKIHNWAPQLGRVLELRMRFVSGRWLDNRALRHWDAVLGLKPGRNAVIPQILNHIGSQNHILTAVHRAPTDPLRHPPAYRNPLLATIGSLHLTLGGVDKAYCNGESFAWQKTDGDFVLKVPKVDFMGMEFENVELIFDLSEDALLISTDAGLRLESAGILYQLLKIGFATIYTYNCTGDPPVKFFDDSGGIIMEWTYETMKWNRQAQCITNLGTDSTDPFTIARYSDVWIVGFNFLQTHCLAYDYSANRIGIGRRRQWLQPTPYT